MLVDGIKLFSSTMYLYKNFSHVKKSPVEEKMSLRIRMHAMLCIFRIDVDGR